MLHAITFDTLAFVKKLEASGIKPKHSECITAAIADVFEKSITALPTKADIHHLDTKIDKLALKFDGKLSKLERKIVKWIVGVAFGQIALLSTIVFSIIKFIH